MDGTIHRINHYPENKYSKNPHIRTYRLNLAFKYLKNIRTFSVWERKIGLYTKKSLLIVKILDRNRVRKFWQRVIVYMFLYSMQAFLLEVQYFCQGLYYDNLWTYWESNQPELWKATLKYKNLFSPTSKILASYMRVFTVLQKPIALSTGQRFI